MVLVVFGAVGLWQTRNHVRGEVLVSRAFATLDGKTVSLADLKGKPVLLAFWAPWCGVCKAETANLNWLRAHAGDAFHVVSIATSYGSLSEVQGFADQNQVAFPVLLGDDVVQSQFQVRAFPTVYFLDEEGRIKNSVVGYSTTLGLWARAWF